jgi:hypothetical protein
VKVRVKLPKIGMTMEEATVVGFCRQPGEAFSKGDPLYEIETEKISQEVEATGDGVVHGKPTPFSLRIAFGALGGVLLELLEPLDDRSPHAEFLAARGEGLHYLAHLVSDFDEQLAAVRAARPEAELLIDGTGPGNPVRWVYVDGAAARGTVIELLERTPQAEAVFGAALKLVAGPRQ